MAIPSFFRQNKPRGFKYTPRYYDPLKEEWDQKRWERSMKQAGDPPDGGETVPQSGRAGSMEHVDERSEEIPRSVRAWSKESEVSGAGTPESKPYRSKVMRGSMKNYFPRNREKLQNQSMIRFVVILIILAFVIYIYLRY
jgi:hypothetical protein